MRFSFIIVTYNSAELIKDCLESINNHIDIPSSDVEIIIVDNSPDEGHEKLLEVTNSVKIDIDYSIVKNNNQGYGQGNNVGIRRAKGDIVCVMNPDVRLTEPLLVSVSEKFESNKNLSLVGFKQMMNNINISFYIRPEYYIPILESLIIKIFNKFEIFSPKYFYTSGAFMFINKAKFEEIGLFDENMFLFFEEPDITRRFRLKNYDIEYDKAKSYIHLLGDHYVFSEFSYLKSMDSWLVYAKKYNLSISAFYRKKIIDIKLYLLISKLIRRENDRSEILRYELKHYKMLLSTEKDRNKKKNV